MYYLYSAFISQQKTLHLSQAQIVPTLSPHGASQSFSLMPSQSPCQENPSQSEDAKKH